MIFLLGLSLLIMQSPKMFGYRENGHMNFFLWLSPLAGAPPNDDLNPRLCKEKLAGFAESSFFGVSPSNYSE